MMMPFYLLFSGLGIGELGRRYFPHVCYVVHCDLRSDDLSLSGTSHLVRC